SSRAKSRDVHLVVIPSEVEGSGLGNDKVQIPRLASLARDDGVYSTPHPPLPTAPPSRSRRHTPRSPRPAPPPRRSRRGPVVHARTPPRTSRASLPALARASVSSLSPRWAMS